MPELLALASAVSYGVADFLGGLATRQRHVLRVIRSAHLVGLAVVLAVAIVAGGSPAPVDLWWGASAGLAGLLGLGFFYWSLSIGTMGVVAPVSAAIGAGIPVLFGLFGGERPSAFASAGVGVAVVAIILTGAGDSVGWIEHRAAARKSLVGAVVAGIGFGIFFVLLVRVDAGAGMWPLVAARAASSTVVIALVAMIRPPATVGGYGLSVAAGAIDISANMFVLAAFDGGLLVIVSVLAALYPAVTVLLARFILLERLRVMQLFGVVMAIGAVAMISMG
ncbi:MAG: DMT family transporter [Acidimicrobiia bacterium]|nr:DMT family transporter [Acidimicrobiia bacterium]